MAWQNNNNIIDYKIEEKIRKYNRIFHGLLMFLKDVLYTDQENFDRYLATHSKWVSSGIKKDQSLISSWLFWKSNILVQNEILCIFISPAMSTTKLASHLTNGHLSFPLKFLLSKEILKFKYIQKQVISQIRINIIFKISLF